jgi:alkylation response protein AidB-like acyl-CoA dehydrogenase
MASLLYSSSVLTLSFRWANQRIAFGKPLHAQPVVRAKLANMIARAETCQAWLG